MVELTPVVKAMEQAKAMESEYAKTWDREVEQLFSAM